MILISALLQRPRHTGAQCNILQSQMKMFQVTNQTKYLDLKKIYIYIFIEHGKSNSYIHRFMHSNNLVTLYWVLIRDNWLRCFHNCCSSEKKKKKGRLLQSREKLNKMAFGTLLEEAACCAQGLKGKCCPGEAFTAEHYSLVLRLHCKLYTVEQYRYSISDVSCELPKGRFDPWSLSLTFSAIFAICLKVNVIFYLRVCFQVLYVKEAV